MDSPRDTCHFWYKSEKIVINHWEGNSNTAGGQPPRRTAAKILKGPGNDYPIHKLLREGLSYARQNMSNDRRQQQLIDHLAQHTKLRKRGEIPDYVKRFLPHLGIGNHDGLEGAFVKIGYGVMEHPDDLSETILNPGANLFSHLGEDSEKLLWDSVIFNKDLLERCLAPPYDMDDKPWQTYVPIVIGLLHGWAQIIYRDWQYIWNDTKPKCRWQAAQICHNARLFADGYIERLYGSPIAFCQVSDLPPGFIANHPAGYPVTYRYNNMTPHYFTMAYNVIRDMFGLDMVPNGGNASEVNLMPNPVVYVQRHVILPPGLGRGLLGWLPLVHVWIHRIIDNGQQNQRGTAQAPAIPPSCQKQHGHMMPSSQVLDNQLYRAPGTSFMGFPPGAQEQTNRTRTLGIATQPSNGQQPGHGDVQKKRGRPKNDDASREQAAARRISGGAAERPIRPKPRYNDPDTQRLAEYQSQLRQHSWAMSPPVHQDQPSQAHHVAQPDNGMQFQQPVHNNQFPQQAQHVPQPHHHRQQQPEVPGQPATAPQSSGPWRFPQSHPPEQSIHSQQPEPLPGLTYQSPYPEARAQEPEPQEPGPQPSAAPEPDFDFNHWIDWGGGDASPSEVE
ncbi:hypothetical protein F5Y18DRAFT_434923 [Xylariaceae sp. FL1019]|nr:hypothetical protein F5Y18DRAFT_434923 [Xylariaceae sp. FL1019]